MEEFEQLLILIETRIKNNIKEGDYLRLMNIISKIYLLKDSSEHSEDESEDYGGQYI
jgi:hypothetical protein